MGVDHRRGDIAVPKELLDRPDVVPGFEEVRGKAVPQGMAGRELREAHRSYRVSERPLQDALMQVVTATLTSFRVPIGPRRGKDPLPGPLPRSVRIFPRESVGQLHTAPPRPEVRAMLLLDASQVFAQRSAKLEAQQRDAVLLPFGVSHEQMPGREVDVLCVRASAFENAEARTVAAAPCRLRNTDHPSQNARYLVARLTSGTPCASWPWPDQVGDHGWFEGQSVTVEEDDCRQSLNVRL